MGEKSGAALAEFVIAFAPLCMMFFVFAQVAHMQMAQLVFRHGAIIAARCNVVTLGPNLPGKWVNNNDASGNGGNAAQNCKDAAIAGLGFWAQLMSGTALSIETVSTTYDGGDQYGDLTTHVEGTFYCAVPWGARLVCGGGILNSFGIGPFKHQFVYDVKLPHEGAQYTLE